MPRALKALARALARLRHGLCPPPPPPLGRKRVGIPYARVMTAGLLGRMQQATQALDHFTNPSMLSTFTPSLLQTFHLFEPASAVSTQPPGISNTPITHTTHTLYGICDQNLDVF